MNLQVKTITAMALIILISGCQEKPNIVGILKNEQYRQQVFEEITKDHQMMSDFLDYAMTNEHAKMMMQSDQGMIEMMMSHNEEMMNFMKDNPELTEQTMGTLIELANEDSIMMQRVMDMMVKDHSMMSTMMD